jgi:hypothetical protein
MAVCKVCGNEYLPSFALDLGCEIELFDNVESAYYAAVPLCACCNGRITGYGIEVGGIFFCCTHCACEYKAIVEPPEKPTHIYQLDAVDRALGEAFC